jgi:hypothetical protein
MMGAMAGDAVEVLRRWEERGGVWRVAARGGGTVVISLLSCTAGEEVDRLTVRDGSLDVWLAEHGTSSTMQ